MVIGAHQEQDIFDRNDQNQRPQRKAEHADYLVRIYPPGGGLGQCLTKCVEWARADIAEHNADGTDGEGERCFRFRLRAHADVSTRPLRTCLPQPTLGPRMALITARMTTEYIN